ncbi:SRPBCC family protein [Mycolicibacterium arseniciresistens]|uniref:SRPBCC family protein n=1 Tax=Mycolicibacterium arseniciresistens TaxID=3062257 RepID=A0ABT8UK49_9MYCO|nr:SRPBCC family protein [Mycolicibacterium arseniciresistens]MDO3638167.1 SRPBCC family protein [Mycolicibacterium arseniciresistens]
MSWWRASSEWTLTEFVPTDPATIRGFYTDLQNLKAVHPLILTVREVAPGRWRVQERNAIGPLAIRMWYSVQMDVDVDGDVIGDSQAHLGVRLRDVVSFEAVDGGTEVVERLRLVAPRPLIGYAHREAVKAHEEMLAGMRRHFEQRPAQPPTTT